MIVNIRRDFTAAELEMIGLAATGKKHKATRKEVTAYVEGAIKNAMAPDRRPTELKSMVCPKCHRPIAVAIPKAEPKESKGVSIASEKVRGSIEGLIKSLDELKKAV